MKITSPPVIAPKTQNPSLDLDFSSAKSTPKPPPRRRKAAVPAGKRGGGDEMVSARKLAARLWRLKLPEAAEGGGLGRSDQRLGFQPAGAGRVGLPFACHRSGGEYVSEMKDLPRSPSSLSGTKNEFMSKHETSLQNTGLAMEGATKWDPPICLKASDEVHQIHNHKKLLEQQASNISIVSALKSELEQAQTTIQELEAERKSSKKKMEHFLKKVSEERAAWRSREHEKVRAFIEDMKAEANRERKNRQRIEIVNSKLVNELADIKFSAKRLMQEYEKQRKARELMEKVCDELANEIGEDKAEAEAMQEESMKFREQVEEERKMLQMAEVWREERVQMKLVDIKVAVEEKYSQMNKLVADLEAFLKSRGAICDVKDVSEAKQLRQAAASINIQDIKKFSYEPPKPDDILSIFEDVNFGDHNEKEIAHCVARSPNNLGSNIQRHSNAYTHQSDEIEGESGWETVSHLEDQSSSFSPEGSTMSDYRGQRDSNVSGSGTEWEDKVRSIPKRQTKKLSSIARLWRSMPNNGDEGTNDRLSNARLSNWSVMSLDQVSSKARLSPRAFMGQWSSPESGNPNINRGRKGCIEWPLGAQKPCLKSRQKLRRSSCATFLNRSSKARRWEGCS